MFYNSVILIIARGEIFDEMDEFLARLTDAFMVAVDVF